MGLEPEYRPYAPVANVIEVIHRVRKRNTPPKIDAEFLSILGVSEGNISRVMAALEFFGLVDESGVPSDTLDSLGGASESDYQRILEGVIKNAYSDEFAKGLDPASDPQEKIQDYFAPRQPRSQIPRMVTLFLGLCREAGMEIMDAPRDRKMRDENASGPMRRPERVAASRQTLGARDRPSNQQREATSGFLGISESDLAALTDEEFATVWPALGTIIRTKLKAADRSRPAPAFNIMDALFPGPSKEQSQPAAETSNNEA